MKKLFYLLLAAVLTVPAAVSCQEKYPEGEKFFLEFSKAAFNSHEGQLYLYNNGGDTSDGVKVYKDWVRVTFKDKPALKDIYGDWTVVNTDKKLKSGQVYLYITGHKWGWIPKGSVHIDKESVTVKAEAYGDLFVVSFAGSILDAGRVWEREPEE
jgi:hypothetical protein